MLHGYQAADLSRTEVKPAQTADDLQKEIDTIEGEMKSGDSEWGDHDRTDTLKALKDKLKLVQKEDNDKPKSTMSIEDQMEAKAHLARFKVGDVVEAYVGEWVKGKIVRSPFPGQFQCEDCEPPGGWL
jgi:hypothetical protein